MYSMVKWFIIFVAAILWAGTLLGRTCVEKVLSRREHIVNIYPVTSNGHSDSVERSPNTWL